MLYVVIEYVSKSVIVYETFQCKTEYTGIQEYLKNIKILSISPLNGL